MKNKITKISVTKQKISGRGGITLFLRYVEKTLFYAVIEHVFSKLEVFGSKGLQLNQFVKQIFAFFIDGTDMSISGFDKKKQDVAYAAVLENNPNEMASSHQIKRFFRKISIVPAFIFRKGSSHSNHGTDYTDSVRDIVKLIRKKYSKTVAIIVNTDSGFFDQKAFDYFEQELKIHYVSTATLYSTLKKEIVKLKETSQKLIKDDQKSLFSSYEKGKQIWNYIEFGCKLKSWNKFRRCVYTELTNKKDGQFLLDFHKSDSAIFTNIGINSELDNKLKGTKAEKYLTSEGLITFSHSKGKDELVHRSLKEFATKEQLPFLKFEMNMVYYYLLVITHFLFETYKIDVTDEIVSIKSYPNTFRRQLIDFAVKIVSHSRNKILQVVETTYNKLKINDLWLKCQNPPQILLIN